MRVLANPGKAVIETNDALVVIDCNVEGWDGCLSKVSTPGDASNCETCIRRMSSRARVCVDEKDLIGSYSADVLIQPEVARLVFSRKLDVRRLITHEFPLAQTADAVDLAAHPTEQSLKVVVRVSERV